MSNLNSNESAKDVVDFVRTDLNSQSYNNINNNNNNISPTTNQPTTMTNHNIKINTNITITNNNILNNKTLNNSTINTTSYHCALLNKKGIAGTLYGDCEVKTSIKSSLSTLEKLSIFKNHTLKRCELSTINKKQQQIMNGGGGNIHNNNNNNNNNNISVNNSGNNVIKDRPKFVKSTSIARLLGNNYNTKKQENNNKNNFNNNNLKKSTIMNNNNSNGICNIGNNTGNGCINTNNRRFSNLERFHKSTKHEEDEHSNSVNMVQLKDFNSDEKVLSTNTFRTISRSLGKLWWKRTHSIDISTPDPEYKVSYLGNVLTGWAKGEGCVEKPLSTLWRNYTQNHKPDVVMRVRLCASGLKATTRQHGLTEYWAHRITHCCAPKNYPRVFCWIYRHEGRKLKHEMRCHAVLCAKESIAQEICNQLRENLDRALREFKREKISRQNARLSLANAAYDNPSLPRRKILLSVGGNNYRPPLERSKSAPKLMAIEEAIGEEEGEEIEETNEPEMLACCQKDSLYPAMTLGRRRCRRGHSIRRTGKSVTTTMTEHICNHIESKIQPNDRTSITKDTIKGSSLLLSSQNHQITNNTNNTEDINDTKVLLSDNLIKQNTKSGSSLRTENYDKDDDDDDDDDDDSDLSYYHNYKTESQTSLTDDLLKYFDMKLKTKTTSLTNLDDSIIYEETNPLPSLNSRTALSLDNLDSFSDGDEDCPIDIDDDNIPNHLFYQQSTILNLLQRNDTPPSLSSSSSSRTLIQTACQQHLDSDGGSISSGCETASTVTANLDDTSLKYQQEKLQQTFQLMNLQDDQLINVVGDQKNRRDHLDINQNEENDNLKTNNYKIHFNLPQKCLRKSRKLSSGAADVENHNEDVSDSEFSDESGYVEFQEQNSLLRNKIVIV